MRTFSLTFVCLLVLLLGATALVSAAPRYPIDYISQAGLQLVNTTVETYGVVIDSEVVTPQPGDTTRGKYTLQDPKTGATIRVMTSTEPPPNGKWMPKLMAVVGMDSTEVYLLAQWQFPWLWVALGVLVVLALALVYVLVMPRRKCLQCGAPVARGQDYCERCQPSPPPPLPLPGEPCPQCREPVSPGANFCDNCGYNLQTGESPVTEPVPEPPPPPRGPGVTDRYPPASVAEFFVSSGPGAAQGHRIGIRKERQKIGVAPDNDITLSGQDKYISGHHAMIWQDDSGTFWLQDEASTNGTFVNGNRITRTELNDGDKVRIGETEMVFRVTPLASQR